MPRGKPFAKGNKASAGFPKAGAGRPADWLREECRKHSGDVLGFLKQVALGEDVEQIITENGETVRVPAPVRERIKAGEILLDRGFGKATQPLEHSGEVQSRMVLIFPEGTVVNGDSDTRD